ncbi:unnamed protein product, partial [Staurois parvus]
SLPPLVPVLPAPSCPRPPCPLLSPSSLPPLVPVLPAPSCPRPPCPLLSPSSQLLLSLFLVSSQRTSLHLLLLRVDTNTGAGQSAWTYGPEESAYVQNGYYGNSYRGCAGKC